MTSRFIRKLRVARREIVLSLTHFSHRFARVLNPMLAVMQWLTVAAAIVCVTAMVVYLGFEHYEHDYLLLGRIISTCQATFLITLIFRMVVFMPRYLSELNWVSRTTDLLLLLTLVPLIFPDGDSHRNMSWIEYAVYSKAALYGILGIYSAMVLCFAAMRLPGKRTNPSLLLSVSFLLFIIIGALLLMLPKSTTHGITFVDSIFVSTSAVCITGLTPVDVATTFTPLGLTILGCLIEIGALGVITFTCFFAMFFSGSSSLFSQLIMKDVIYSKSMSSLLPTMLYILSFTVAVEAVGAVAIFLTIPDCLGLGLEQKIGVAAFHSVSAFCNAGFSNLPDGMANPAFLNGNQAIYWVMSAIIISGAIGFPLLVNVRDAVATKLTRIFKPHKAPASLQRNATIHLFDMNTKIVIVSFVLLFAGGAGAFLLLEGNHSMQDMSMWQKVSQAVFNSVTPRSAGFVTLDPASFLTSTLVIVMFLMWVGGGSQSTAGGIKVNTLAAVALNIRAIVTNRRNVTAFHRNIAFGSIRRANAVVAVSILTFTAYVVIMLIIEPNLPARQVVFETLSALFTVGSSMGITSHMSATAKIVLCTAMLFGRVGLLSLVAGLTGHSRKSLVEYPTDNIIIN